MRYLLLFCFLPFFACRQSNSGKEAASKLSGSDSTASSKFYPLGAFIREELTYLEENPTGIMQYRETGGKKDSGYVDLKNLKQWSARFLEDDINSPSLRGHIKETGFRDASLDVVTLSYTTDNPDIPLKRADVLVKEGATSGKVSSLYMERSYQRNDTLVNEKLYWKSRKNCMIIEQMTLPDGKEVTQLVRMVWEPSEL